MSNKEINEKLIGYLKKFKDNILEFKKEIAATGTGVIDTIKSKKIVNKKRFIISGVSAVLALTIILYVFLSFRAYSVNINGEEIAKVRHKDVINKAIMELKEQYQLQNGGNINIDSIVEIKNTRAKDSEVIAKDALIQKLKNNLEYSIEACSINVGGKPILYVKSEEIAKVLLFDIQSHFLKNTDTSKIKETKFSENVELKSEFAPISNILEKHQAFNILIKGTDEIKTHKVEKGESFWTISKKYDISIDDLIKANPDIAPEKIQIGQELSMIVPKPIISVMTVETATYKDKIPFEQKLEYSDSMYKDETRVKSKGEYGEAEIVADIIRINGIEKERKVLSQKEIKAPKTQILVKGTKNPPPKKGTGTFSQPSRGTLTSKFGMRWGRMHNGIDLAAPIGTPVKASDGGVVIFVGTDGGYGKIIKIDHGAGYVTYYGHLNSYKVKKGDKVYKGQTIGTVGNTGRSTGPHLHFEIRKNGVPQNPLKYL